MGAPGMTGGPESVNTAQPPSMVSSHSPASTSSVSSSGSYGGYQNHQNRVGPTGPPPPRSIYQNHNSNQPPGGYPPPVYAGPNTESQQPETMSNNGMCTYPPVVVNNGPVQNGNHDQHGVTVTMCPTGQNGDQAQNGQRGQHTVHFHVHQGEAVSLQLGEQVQMIQGPATVRMVSTS